MKVFNPGIHNLDTNGLTVKEQKKAGVEGPSFSEILEKTSKEDPVTAASLSRAGSVGQPVSLSMAQNHAIAKAEEILNLLNHLGSMFGSSGTSDSALKTTAEAISDRLQELRELRDGLDMSDPLRDTLNEVGTLSIVEEAKITRGDYGE